MTTISDTFGTTIAIIPAFLFFFLSFIVSLTKTIQKRGTKYNLIKTMSNLVLIPSLIIPIVLSDHGLPELTQKRIQIIKNLKPAFVKYQVENGRFPKALRDLVPAHIQAIPNELLNEGIDDLYKKFRMLWREVSQFFIFVHTVVQIRLQVLMLLMELFGMTNNPLVERTA